MATLGAMLAQRPIFSVETLEQTLKDHLPSSKTDLLEKNFLVLRQGYRQALAVST
jgi:Pyruvate/2-oxoacid:ferredoxin oxidoreductase gamma subunit